jgi:putative SOS response-associated peptidase YedK
MCGRFDNLIARDAYRGLFKAQRLPKSNFPLRYNVAPTDQIPIVRIDPHDGALLGNARVIEHLLGIQHSLFGWLQHGIGS